MPFRNILEPAKLATLTKVLNDYCQEAGIVDEQSREEVAFQVVQLFQNGTEDEKQLATALRLLRTVKQRRA